MARTRTGVEIGDRVATPKAAGLTLPQAVLLLQPVFQCWTGRCTTSQQPIDLADLPLRRPPQRE